MIMKILHYIPSIDESSGGVGAYMQLLARDLGKLCELHVITHKSGTMLDLENCHIHFIPLNNNPFSNKSKKEFLTLLKDIKPAVFHVNCCWLPQSARTAIWAKEKGYKVAYSPHGMLEPWILNRHYWTRKLPAILLYQRKAIEIADVVHATAKSEEFNILRLRWNRKVCVIPNCVQVDKIKLKSSWGKKKKILFLSRIHVKKGIEYLIGAAAKMREELKGYKIIIAGQGEFDYVNSLKSMAEEKKVGKIFNFVGPVYGDDKWAYYRNADFFILPTHSENFGIVVPEALASGTPVVTTHGAPWEELNTYNCGWWVPIGMPPMVDALRWILSRNEVDLEGMGRNGRRLVEERYSSQSVAVKFMEMYFQLSVKS